MNIRCANKENILFNIILLAAIILGNTFSVKTSNIVYDEDTNKMTFAVVENKIDKRFTINTKGCSIPNVNPNNVHVRRLLDPITKVAPPCPNHDHPLIAENKTHIIALKENFKYYKIKNAARLNCCYKTFYRPNKSFGIPNIKADDRIEYSECIYFHDITKVYHEFVHVNCSYKGKQIYKQFFIFALKKTFTAYRANPFISERSMYNILIMGLGSVSRQNFFRTMPKTWNILKKFGAVELKGYGTVAADTFQNLIPALTGMDSSQLRSTCWPKPQDTLDSCPYIWERFKDIGYYTVLAEDTARYSVFHMGKPGFRGTPTDYYIYPFIHESESRKKAKRYNYKLQWWMTRNERRIAKLESAPVPTCMGDKYYFQVLLNYIESLTSVLSNSRMFGLFWESSMSNENLSSPRMMDDSYVKLLKSLQASGYLENTIMIFLSDHGMNIGNIHSMKQGQIEQRQPIFYMFTPEIFRIEFNQAYENFKQNKDRLTTPYDVHATLIDLLDLSDITDGEITKRSKEFYSNDKGISLFLPIPANRTCQMAGINEEWCNCYNYIKVALSNFTRTVGVYQFLTKQLNEPLKPYPQCFELFVADIVEAYELVPSYEKNQEWRDFKIIVKTAPGGGLFEAILRFYKGINHWALVNAIKRLNENNKNACVTDDYIKLYCYCV